MIQCKYPFKCHRFENCSKRRKKTLCYTGSYTYRLNHLFQRRTHARDISIDQARELVEELEKTDPEGAELLKLKLLTGVVEG